MIKIVLLGIYALITCIAILAITYIRKHNVIIPEEHKDIDFIETLINYKKKSLSEQPWNMNFDTYVSIGTFFGVVLSALFYVTKGLPMGVLAGIVGFLIPELIVKIQSAAQKQKFEERYARSLRQLSAALKSGLSLHQAIEDVCSSPFVHDDIKKEYQQLSAEVKLGIPIQDGFQYFADRVGFADAQDVAIAVGMQTKVGGREGAVIESVAQNISDRMMLRKEINSMFAGSNVTVTVLDVLPLAIVTFLVFGAQTFMHLYFESVGMLLLFGALVGIMIIGSFVTHSMIRKMKRECGVL